MIILFVLMLSAGGAAQPHGKLIQSDASECGIIADHFFADSDSQREIWLRLLDSSEKPSLLAKYGRNAEVVFSQDCSMIALNDNLGSNISEVRLFRRSGGLTYKSVPDDIAAKAWNAIARIYNSGKPLRLRHDYINAIGWSSDSRAVLLRVWGHTDLENHVDEWYCVYEVSTGRISSDLSVMNRNAVMIKGKSY